HDGGEPVAPAGQAGIKKGGYRVDADRPGNGDVDEELDPSGRGHVMAFAFQHVPADQDIEQEIAVQDEDIPKHDRVGSGVLEDVEHPVRPPHVHHHEGDTHDYRGHRQEFPQDGDPAEGLVVVQVVRENHHDRGGRHSDQIGKLGDVKAPGDVPAHAGDAQAGGELFQIE